MTAIDFHRMSLLSNHYPQVIDEIKHSPQVYSRNASSFQKHDVEVRKSPGFYANAADI